MEEIRIKSISPPLDDRDLIGPAVAVIRRALALGLVTGDGDRDLDLALIGEVADAAASDGVAREVALALRHGSPTPDRLRSFLVQLEAGLVGSPMPERELPVLWQTLGADALADLLGTAVISLRRYVAGDRATPDAIAARAHWLSLVIGDLAGTYNDAGIRRWFERPRPQLDGRSPRAALGTDWDPDGPAADAVAALAGALVGPGMAT